MRLDEVCAFECKKSFQLHRDLSAVECRHYIQHKGYPPVAANNNDNNNDNNKDNNNGNVDKDNGVMQKRSFYIVIMLK